MRRMTAFAFAFVCIQTLGGNVSAHYTFIVPEAFRVASGQAITIGVHSADGFPESAQVAKRIQDPTIHAANGRRRLEGLEDEGKRLTMSLTVGAPGHVVITAVNGTATTEIEPDAFVEYLREEGLTHVVDARTQRGEADQPGKERYTMYAKAILIADAPSEGYKTTAGLPLEMVPEKDPYRLGQGESLPVRILLRGAPAPNLAVRAVSTAPGTKPYIVGRTDADGRIMVPVRQGQWRLHTIHMERTSGSDADWESLWTTLTFEIF